MASDTTFPSRTALVLLAATVCCANLAAAEHVVRDDAAFKAAIGTVQPGDTIILAPGDYGRLEWDKEGTREKRITIRRMTRAEYEEARGKVKSEKDLEVRFKILRLGGAHTTFDGFRVLGDAKEKYNSAGLSGHHVRLTNATFDDCVNKTWLTVVGYENEVDHCAFLRV